MKKPWIEKKNSTQYESTKRAKAKTAQKRFNPGIELNEFNETLELMTSKLGEGLSKLSKNSINKVKAPLALKTEKSNETFIAQNEGQFRISLPTQTLENKAILTVATKNDSNYSFLDNTTDVETLKAEKSDVVIDQHWSESLGFVFKPISENALNYILNDNQSDTNSTQTTQANEPKEEILQALKIDSAKEGGPGLNIQIEEADEDISEQEFETNTALEISEEQETRPEENSEVNEESITAEDNPQKELSSAKDILKKLQNNEGKKNGDRASITPRVVLNQQYNLPFEMLRTRNPSLDVVNPKEIQKIISTLEETLDQFGIEGRVIGIQKGPIITRYEVKMAPGIKVSRILGLSDELAMALEALRVRIEAPIPGRSTVGIEIPNKKRAQVLLGDILKDPAYREFNAALPLPMGKDIAGNLILEDLAKMPHILIAGATGSGKSVAVNSFITSLILNKSPEHVRFLLIDPKLVELSHFNDIPHLLHPVITDHQKAIQALNWTVEEMERRYEDMAEMRSRDIKGYNTKVAKLKTQGKQATPMPYIVLLIDELGDLMMVAGKEVEGSIIRLSQKARAVGIHLVLATQRPSVDVITALIKANCPARIGLQVAQKTDSRTILDSNGSEHLLGKGDMLFKHPSKAQLLRVQSPLVLDEEVEKVVNNAIKMGKPSYIKLEDPKENAGQLDDEDETLFEEAWCIILESGKASASYLQRRLRIGYNRAARLIEAFEARGLIGPQIGSKPREILVSSRD